MNQSFPTSINEAYQQIKTEATLLAGSPGDIPQRVAILHIIYLDSKGNHTFPQVALHGALWAYGFFETTGTLGRIISYRYVYSKTEKAVRLEMLRTFSESFKEANRCVFIDTYTNYYFSKQYGKEGGADKIVNRELLSALNEMHETARKDRAMSKDEKSLLFRTSLEWEQEKTVGPKVKEEVSKFSCPILTSLVLRPLVRFKYFPKWQYLLFKDFSDTAERIEKALKSYELAERAGWNTVMEAMRDYHVLPETVLKQPREFVEKLKTDLLRSSRPPLNPLE